MTIRLLSVVFSIVTLSSAGCGFNVRQAVTPSQIPLTMTATMSPTFTPQPSETPLPPLSTAQPITPRVTPVEGLTSTQINVRAEPSTASNVLGMIAPNTKVEIIGKDPTGNWWQINYPQGKDGKGWVTAQYVTTLTQAEVPVIGGNQVNPIKGNVAVVQQQLNVRSGPGTGFNSLGTLNPQDVASLIGKDPNGAWLQINFAAGPEGKGWVNAAFVQAKGVENLPIITEAGLIVGTGTPTMIPFTPTPTIVPAWEDHDSVNRPIASVIFEPAGTQTLIYNGDLSSPRGDMEDWIAFKPYSRLVSISLACTGHDSLKIQIMENNSPANFDIACGDQRKEITVNPSSNYLVHLQAISSADNLQYTNYILTIKTRP